MNSQFDRRNFLKTLSLGATSLVISCRLFPNESTQQKPNILFFFTDDQRFDTINALGNEHIITPNIDSLVRNGTTFTNAFIMGGTSPAVCAPSRAMLMTGRYLFHLDKQGFTITEKNETMPETMRKAGYTTFGTGKWHNGSAAYARSFSTGDKIFFGGMSDHYRVPFCDFEPTGKYPDNEALKELKEKVKSGEKGIHSSELFSNAAIQFLNDYKEVKPFFVYIAYTAPHDPREMPSEYQNMYDPGKIPLPKNFMPEHPFDNGELKIRDEKLAPWLRTPEIIRRHITDYYAMITHLDAQIGRVLDTLKESGNADNTIIIFAGDNGLALGQHGLLGKQNVYEHSVHIPLVMSGPGIPKGETRDSLCYLLDIFPTLCDFTGVSIPDTVEGKSLLPLIYDKEIKHRESVFFAYKDLQRAVRTSRWKIIKYNVNGKQATQLFDLQNDRWELKNLADDRGKIYLLRGMTDLLKDWMKKTGDTCDLDKPNWGKMHTTGN